MTFTPLHLELLIHYTVCCAAFHNRAPLCEQYALELAALNLIRPQADEMGRRDTTKGKRLLDLLCNFAHNNGCLESAPEYEYATMMGLTKKQAGVYVSIACDDNMHMDEAPAADYPWFASQPSKVRVRRRASLYTKDLWEPVPMTHHPVTGEEVPCEPPRKPGLFDRIPAPSIPSYITGGNGVPVNVADLLTDCRNLLLDIRAGCSGGNPHNAIKP